MPFTLAHPAAALPFARLLGPLGVPVALAIGAMAPDLAYWLPRPVDRSATHALDAVVWFCLPAGLAGYAAFYGLVAPLLVALAPGPLCARLPEHWARGRIPSRPLVCVAVSVVAGALTHLAWDACTHRGGAVVARFPVLAEAMLSRGGYTLHGYGVLQHAGSLAGLLVLAWWAARWLDARPRRAIDERASRVARLALLTALAGPGVCAAVLSGLAALDPTLGALARAQHVAGHAVRAAGSVFIASLLLTGAAWRLSSRPRQR